MWQSAGVAPDAVALLLTGAQASGKTTVGRALATSAARGVFLDGDVFWQAVVSGRADMDAQPTAEAQLQLQLRYRALAAAGRLYAEAGFFTVLCDNAYGDAVRFFAEAIAPVRLLTVALVPSPEALAARERLRGSAAYDGWLASGDELLDTLRTFDSWVRDTPADLHHDSTGETPEQTATAIFEWVQGRL